MSALAALLFFPTVISHAAASTDYPVIVAKLPNLNDYSLFANAGWDGNWYVGYNTCWVKKLLPIPAGTYQRAYIGVKLGRMKLIGLPKKPWEPQTIPGQLYIAFGSTPAWSPSQAILLTDTSNIPLEGDAENAIVGVGESEWFWAEVPLSSIHPAGDHYVALWSTNPAMVTVSSSPVIAAGWGGKDVDSWLAKDTHGAPPDNATAATSTPISYFQPAIALKLIPMGTPHPMLVRLISWQNGTTDHPQPVITASVNGDSVESARVEFQSADSSTGPGTWIPVGRAVWKAPYIFSLDQSHLPPGKIRLRIVATNVWEEQTMSDAFTVEVSQIHAKNP